MSKHQLVKKLSLETVGRQGMVYNVLKERYRRRFKACLYVFICQRDLRGACNYYMLVYRFYFDFSKNVDFKFGGRKGYYIT